MNDIDTAIKNFPTVVRDGVVYLEGNMLCSAFALAGLESLISGDLVYAEAMAKAASLVGQIVDGAK